ncbi:Uncharacterized protein dnl_54210 [Desulfonema limicola]|uniref:Uncharacterized protein n=1 Tax=Desulfonema limicola TaxID=45656 RepID=A0A975BD02_9BACT|nr:hypothetical protein [Desulfonema limicola]QTA83028.1 Uncharacterized protein dnl_54210 [Desulfonema limicola]
MESIDNSRKQGTKILVFKHGRTYFTKEGERRFYFFLTLLMLLSGILYKIGIF